MQMLVGTVTSAPCIAVEAEAANDNMFLLTPSATAIDSIAGENAFRVCFSDPAQGTKSAQYIGENKIATKVAVTMVLTHIPQEFMRASRQKQKTRDSRL